MGDQQREPLSPRVARLLKQPRHRAGLQSASHLLKKRQAQEQERSLRSLCGPRVAVAQVIQITGQRVSAGLCGLPGARTEALPLSHSAFLFDPQFDARKKGRDLAAVFGGHAKAHATKLASALTSSAVTRHTLSSFITVSPSGRGRA